MYRKTVLDNGLRIISERLPHSRLASLGIWVDVGSRDEHDLNNGCAHFVEHMLFKGTAKRTAEQIARELDTLGGTTNAFTSRDTTCYYGTVLDQHLPILIDILADIFFNSKISLEEIEREKQVILQEISMVEDMPEDQIHDLFAGLLWGHHPLGNTVLGRREVISAITPEKLIAYMESFYTPERIIIAATGNMDHDELVARWSAITKDVNPRSTGESRRAPQLLTPRKKIYPKPLEQAHVLLGTYGLNAMAPERYAFMLLNVLLGGNMSSRLFQELREKHGLAYSVYSYAVSYNDCGYLAIYLGIDPATINESLGRVVGEINRLLQEPVPEKELADVKKYVKAGFFLAAENMESIMIRIARNELTYNRYITFEEEARGIDQVTVEDIGKMAATLFTGDMTMAALGPLASNDVDLNLLKGIARP